MQHNATLTINSKRERPIVYLWIKLGRLTYVCATCSEHFTRKYSASRHNLNIHNGGAEIVRLIDYIVGRVSGRYLATHPSWYRREQKWQTHSNHIYDNKFRPATVTDSSGDTFQRIDARQQAPQANMYYSSHYSNAPAFQQDDQRYGTRLSRVTRLKIEELETLLIKYKEYFHDVNEIFKWTVSWANKGDDRYLDEKLAVVRNLDKRLKMKGVI